jgi:hypothetical protein
MELSNYEREKLKEHLKAIAKILYQATPSDNLKTFSDDRWRQSEVKDRKKGEPCQWRDYKSAKKISSFASGNIESGIKEEG